MDTITALKTRRSIRQFTGEEIDKDILNICVECGMFAPSAGNEQPWHFIIITNRQILEKIPSIHQYAKMMPMASAGILVCFDPSLEKHKQMSCQDCAAATQNILLAAHAQGIGSCWLGIYPRRNRMDGFRRMFNIPDDIIPFSLVAIGVSQQKKMEADRFNPNRVH
mgnify:FL=1